MKWKFQVISSQEKKKKSDRFILVSTFLSVLTQLKLCSKYFANKTKMVKVKQKLLINISLEPERKKNIKKTLRVSIQLQN